MQNSSHNASGSTSASTSSLNANSTGSSFNSIDGGFSSEGSSFGSFDNGFSSAGSSFGNDGFSPSGGSSFDSFDSSGSSFGVNPVSNTSSPSAVVANSAPASNTTSLANATTQNRTNASSSNHILTLDASTPTTSAQNTVVIGGITINPSTPVPPIVIEPTSNLVICHDNQKLLSGQCVCDDFSIAIDEVNCFRCVPGSFKDDAFCSSCIDQCINCTSTHNCFQCVDGWHYNSQKHLC